MLYPFKGNRQFQTTKEKSSHRTLTCVVYPLPDTGGADIRCGVGVDCLFRCRAFGDASLEDKQEVIPRFFRINGLTVESGMEETPKNCYEEKLQVPFIAARCSM